MFDLRQLRQFVAVAEELHFRRAAARLNMSQPPLTTAVRRLEEDIGAVLVERGNRTVRLTAAGEVLLVEARRILAQADHALAATRDAARGRTGVVRLGYVGSATYGRLPAVIRRFRDAFPEVRLELREMTSAALVAALRRDELDLAVLIPPLADGGDLVLADFDQDRLALALPAGHPLAGVAASVADLAGQPFILWPATEGQGFHFQVVSLCVAAGFSPRVVQEAHGMHAVLSLVAAEAGVSIVPASMASVLAAAVRYRPLDEPEAVFTLAIGRRDTPPSPATANFLATAMEVDTPGRSPPHPNGI